MTFWTQTHKTTCRKYCTWSVFSLSSGSYSEGESKALSEGNRVASWLDKLCSPIPSVLARKRKVSMNPPPVTQKWLKGGFAFTVWNQCLPKIMWGTLLMIVFACQQANCSAYCVESNIWWKRVWSTIMSNQWNINHQRATWKRKKSVTQTLWMLCRDAASRSIQRERHCLATLVCITSSSSGILKSWYSTKKIIDSYHELLKKSAFSLSSSHTCMIWYLSLIQRAETNTGRYKRKRSVSDIWTIR